MYRRHAKVNLWLTSAAYVLCAALSVLVIHTWTRVRIAERARTCIASWALERGGTSTGGVARKIAVVTFTADVGVAKQLQAGTQVHANFRVRAKEFSSLTHITMPNKESYAVGHGYAFVDASELVDASRPASWSKIPAVLAQLDSGQHEWVFWVDSDTVFTNFDLPVEALLPPPNAKGPDLLLVEDASGYNAGVWLISNSSWSRAFLHQWWGMSSFIRHTVGDTKSGDNDALKHYLANMDRDEFETHVGVAPQCAFNSYMWRHSLSNWCRFLMEPGAVVKGLWHPGDLLLHLAGISNKMAALDSFTRRYGAAVIFPRNAPGAGDEGAGKAGGVAHSRSGVRHKKGGHYGGSKAAVAKHHGHAQGVGSTGGGTAGAPGTRRHGGHKVHKAHGGHGKT